jgi:hypothetical protein
MKRTTTVLLAALDALLVIALGIGIALVPLVLVWATRFGLGGDGLVVWRAAGDIWLLGHGVDLRVQLDELTALRIGVADADRPFELTIAALGFALLTVALGIRTGRRGADSGRPWLAAATAVVVLASLTAPVVLSLEHPVAAPIVWQGMLLPPLVLAVGLAIGLAIERDRLDLDRIAQIPEPVRAVIGGAIRGGIVVVAGVLGVAAIAVAALIVTDYSTIVGLYQALQADVAGGIALTVGQLAVLPNIVVWAGSWMLGPGFALGAGTTISPSATVVGPVPGAPLLGILPDGGGAIGYLGLVVPVVFGFLGGMLAQQRATAHARAEPAPSGAWTTRRHPTALVTGATGVAIGLAAGALLGLLAWWSSGAAGPGRLAEVGADGWLVAGTVALAAGVPAVIGGFAARMRGGLSED